eukprot:CAMPEP_0195286796 /NCGR_PEP_ID=MMETSP0707-20130614/4119_1 /TAXON_ID=33640 /ORGANISM="Asterionellopsis glacialis, Strain CCMP134" /LENGTH=535 /DNA_ID=CAMNT_0040346485 /DNA_START=134 /DNA_END=1741 /DNA_ORIENTATION=+
MTPRPESPTTANAGTFQEATPSPEGQHQILSNIAIDTTTLTQQQQKQKDTTFASPPRQKRLKIDNDDVDLTTTKSSASLTSTPALDNILTKDEGEQAIQSFQKFLTYPTVSSVAPDTGAYIDCANYIMEQLESVKVVSDIHIIEESPKSSPIVVGCWKGSDPTLPVILLNSHYDVVPVDTKDWTVDPFEGKRLNGKIYGRGTQDMKCVCIQYIEALRKIHAMDPSFQPTRSIYLSFVPDEETGGRGMAAFLDSNLYKNTLAKQGIALALDEGMASETSAYNVFYGERLPWVVDVTAKGPTGHGSRFIDHTAVGQLLELSQKALEFRSGQRALLGLDDHSNCAHAVVAANMKKKNKTRRLGDVTTLNITSLEAGVKAGDSYAYNCVPPVARCSMDIRVPPNIKPRMIADMLDMWCKECSSDPSQGYEVSWSHLYNKQYEHGVTSTDTTVNPWYGVFANTLTNMGLKIDPQIFPGGTDSRFLRALGIRALGFSPMRNTEIMLHEVDEYIPEDIFVEGVGVYASLIRELGKQGREIDV